MKIVFAGGGTAGHVNPALAVAGYICKQEPGSQVFLSGGKGNIEEKLAAKAGYPIYTFPLKGLSRSKSLAGIQQTVRALVDMQKATGECKKILKDLQPDVVMGTGGYASFPMVRAAAQLGIKTAILEVNATPGIATKQLAKKVDCTMLSFAETEQLVPGGVSSPAVPSRRRSSAAGKRNMHLSLITTSPLWSASGAVWVPSI